MIGGVYGRILHVDLASQTYETEALPDEVYGARIGGKGVGTYLLMRDVEPTVDPLSPLNKLIFCLGPLTGTPMHAVSRYAVFTKSPLTGIYSESYSGGHAAPMMKATGFDAFVFHGKAQSPTYVVMTDTGVSFRDASHLWGKETYETEDTVAREAGLPGAQPLVIGPAGENRVAFAGIVNNYWRCAGRTGVGAVMGSKNLKAIVFHGSTQTPLAHPERVREFVRDFVKRAGADPGVKGYQAYGTPQLVALLNKVNAFPTRYWREGYKNGWERIGAEYLVSRMGAKPMACHRCLIACGKLSTCREGPRKGLRIEGPEYETIYAFGGVCDIDSLEDVAYLNDLCDRLGIDTISSGNIAGLLMEATARGEFRGGVNYGDTEAVAGLIRDIAYRRGLGDTLARGIRPASTELGLSHLAIHVKGMEPAAYDPRVLKGMGLAYATSPRGACHLRATFYKAELAGIIDPNQIEGKAALFVDWENRLVIQDTGVMCRFTRDLMDWERMAELFNAVTGLEYGVDEFKRIANDILTDVRRFNLATGMTPDADTLPDRLFDEPLPPSGAVITRDELATMLREYYAARGWSREGLPDG